jgi:hypothetical protein
VRAPRTPKPALVCFLMLLAFVLAPAGAASAAGWSATQLPAQPASGGGTDQVPLDGVACASKALCLTVGAFDTLAWSTAPTGGAGAWHVVNPPYPEEPGEDCAAGPHAGSEECHLYGRLQAVSCASESLCVVVSHEGIIGVSTDPTGPASAWTSTDPKHEGAGQTHLVGVSCPLESLCVAVSGGASRPGDPVNGKILTTTEPAAGHWKLTQLSSSLEFTAVSCGATNLCVATARGGRLVVSTNPTGGPGAWREVDPGGAAGDLGGVGCFSSTLCLVGNATGTVFTSSEAGGTAGWSAANAGGSVAITDIDCALLDRCVAVDDNGDVSTTVDPEGGTGSWHFENLSPFHQTTLEETVRNALFGVSCPSAVLCVLVGADSEIFTSTDPFAVAEGRAAPAPGPSAGGKVVKRPKTILLLAEGFYFHTRSRHHRVRARFHFYAKSKVRGFLCSRDRGRWRRCRSPLRYWVGVGHHTLRVRAIGPTGLLGPPAIRHFAVARPRPLHVE